jgi:hypothetical protein
VVAGVTGAIASSTATFFSIKTGKVIMRPVISLAKDVFKSAITKKH